MNKNLKRYTPLFVGILVLLVLVGIRMRGMSLIPKEGRWPDVAGGMYSTPVMKNGVNYLVPPDELYENGLGKDGIPAINAPAYVTVAAADDVLDDTVDGIDVEVNGKHRFYSFQILNWHELVNERFGDQELLISYSPLCGSAVVYDRKIEGAARTFGDAGFVYNNCAVLYDTVSSVLWNQATGVAIVGDGGMTLTRYPSTVMTWDEWKKAYPNGEVLSTDTGLVRDYRRHPYGNYDKNNSLFFPVNKLDTKIAKKDLVDDYLFEDQHVGATAKFLSFVKEPNYEVNLQSETGTVFYSAFVDDDSVVRLFDSAVDDVVLHFVRENNEIKDKETDSRWNAEGLCIKGKLRGKQLVQLTPSARYFAFAYISQFPEATMPGYELFNAPTPEPTPEPTTEPTAVPTPSLNVTE